MARSMRLFLIRHGETVDNVAQLYAGSRDSELTSHGFQQATRLGLHFQAVGLSFTHLFSSHLQRAAKTAGKIRDAQLMQVGAGGLEPVAPDVVQLPILMEQDFGTMEGKKWYDRAPESKVSGQDRPRQSSVGTTRFVDVEAKGSMARRADTFLDEHLLPLLDDSITVDPVVAVVSHGIFVSTLWKRLLLRLPLRSVQLSAELQAIPRTSLEHLGGWSNTGYLEVHMINAAVEADQPPNTPSSVAIDPNAKDRSGEVETQAVLASDDVFPQQSESKIPSVLTAVPSHFASSRIAHGWRTTIFTINGKDHLKGLKRTGGGIGSARHDATQKHIQTFFKRRKTD